MPIFMDRHDVSDTVTAEQVAHLHQEDLKVQHKFNCKGFTYWFDDKRKMAFCLVEAPNKESLEAMHDEAHGQVPHSIIEVDNRIVESFLGRIKDPEKSGNEEFNIINDPPFRILMVIVTKTLSLRSLSDNSLDLVIKNLHTDISNMLEGYRGRVVKHKTDYFLVSFDSVSNAIVSALKIQNLLSASNSDLKINIGINSGIPVTENKEIFEDTIKLAERLCWISKGKVVVSNEVGELLENEILNTPLDKNQIDVINEKDENFLNSLMDFTEREWMNTLLTVDNFSRFLGYSKPQLYRKVISLTGKSINSFIKDYRLNNALKMLCRNKGNVSEIAFESGFNSPAYFSKCFHETYGVLPSAYLRKTIDI
ncbi:MAG: DUF4242 domain-containing protein [Cyclobacteriaceae bacterium]|nr:DUF4242 domain-containing protein [Cyclobacteriaceae bacterium]